MESIQDMTIKYLKNTGRKQKWLAQKLGVSPSQISAWLKFKAGLPMYKVDMLVKIINAG